MLLLVASVPAILAHGAPQPPQTPPDAGGRGQGRGAGRGAVFPAQQRPPGDPMVIERGKTLYGIHCTACHGADTRGGDLGGPNLLRSQLVLNDQNGELILPIVRGSREDQGMPAINLPDDDVKAIAEFIHSVAAAARGQGAPPLTAPPPDVLVGDAAAGQVYFTAKCSGCHSATGDLQGIATKSLDAKTLQNRWVSGGVGGRGGGRQGGGMQMQSGMAPASAPVVTVTVAPSGKDETRQNEEKVEGRLVRIDDFIVTLAQADGTVRTFRRDGDRPEVEIRDPLAAHRALLAVLTDKDMHDVTAYLATLK
jgi:cytochrome c oxidase cbb3-type subunit 3